MNTTLLNDLMGSEIVFIFCSFWWRVGTLGYEFS